MHNHKITKRVLSLLNILSLTSWKKNVIFIGRKGRKQVSSLAQSLTSSSCGAYYYFFIAIYANKKQTTTSFIEMLSWTEEALNDFDVCVYRYTCCFSFKMHAFYKLSDFNARCDCCESLHLLCVCVAHVASTRAHI